MERFMVNSLKIGLKTEGYEQLACQPEFPVKHRPKPAQRAQLADFSPFSPTNPDTSSAQVTIFVIS
jgi:hypothetical protein